MKALVVVYSVCHGNTAKVAQALAEVWGADLRKPSEVDPKALADYDFLSLGSGIYFGKHHWVLLDWAGQLPSVKGKKVTIFSTGGSPQEGDHAFLKKILLTAGYQVIGEFHCPGFYTYGPLIWIGGIHKGRPNKADLEKATGFARNLQVSRESKEQRFIGIQQNNDSREIPQISSKTP